MPGEGLAGSPIDDSPEFNSQVPHGFFVICLGVALVGIDKDQIGLPVRQGLENVRGITPAKVDLVFLGTAVAAGRTGALGPGRVVRCCARTISLCLGFVSHSWRYRFPRRVSSRKARNRCHDF